MAKRRRVNGSLEEGTPPDSPASFADDGPNGPAEAAPAVPFGLERTPIIETAAPRIPPAPPAPPRAPEAPPRNGPPEAVPIGNASLAAPQALPLPPIEMRIRRLEDALAQLQQMRAAELRVTGQPGAPARPADPAAEPPMQAPTDKLWEFGKRVLAVPAEAARQFAAGPDAPEQARSAWLLTESVAEARAIVRMFTDPRYRLSWTARIVPPVLTFLIVASWWWVPFTSVPIFGGFLDKAVDLVLAFVLFKLLGHEARRYRETAPDLPPSLRL